MSQVGEFFAANIVPIYFVYGLAFFVLGLVMALQARTPARLHPLNYIWLLSVFGLLHGLSEWIALATILGMLDPVPVANLDLGLKALSFAFLLQFGAELLRVWRPGLNWLRALGPAIFLAWLLFILAAPLGGPVGSPAWLDLFDVTARYAIPFTGAALPCYALLLSSSPPSTMACGPSSPRSALPTRSTWSSPGRRPSWKPTPASSPRRRRTSGP